MLMRQNAKSEFSEILAILVSNRVWSLPEEATFSSLSIKPSTKALHNYYNMLGNNS